MKVLLFLLQKEFIQIGRDKTILLLLFLITVILVFILPRSAQMRLGQVPLSVVDHDRTEMSSKFLQKLVSTDCFTIGAYEDSYEEGLKKMEMNETEGLVVIPRGFEKKMMTGKGASVRVEIDAVNSVLAGLSSFYFTQIYQQYLMECLAGVGFQTGFTLESQEELMAKAQAQEPSRRDNQPLVAPAYGGKAATDALSRYAGQSTLRMTVDVPAIEGARNADYSLVELTTSKRYNPDGISRKYQIAAIIAILVCLVGTVLSALNIVTEKESGTIEQMNVTPVRKSVFILSKLIPSWVIGMLILTLGLFFSWLLYGVTPEGGYLGIYVVSFIFLMAMVGFGVLLSTACRNQQQVMLLCFFFLLIICLLCGMWSPIGSMPVWARFIADINPLRYYVEAIRLFYAYGSSLGDATRYIWILCVFIAIFNIWAVWNFRKAR